MKLDGFRLIKLLRLLIVSRPRLSLHFSHLPHIIGRVLFKHANNNRKAGNLLHSSTQSLLNTVRGCFESKHHGVHAAALVVGLFNQRLTSKCACWKRLLGNERKLGKLAREREMGEPKEG